MIIKPHCSLPLAAFESAGVDVGAPMVTTCGSGITACILALAAHLLNNEVAVYDVSIT